MFDWERIWKISMRWGQRLGCHQRPDRSFFFHGYQFPICARCTGLLIGYLFTLLIGFLIDLSFFQCVILCIPMAIDGITQLVEWRESNQFLRLTTGILCGVGITRIEVNAIVAIVHLLRR